MGRALLKEPRGWAEPAKIRRFSALHSTSCEVLVQVNRRAYNLLHYRPIAMQCVPITIVFVTDEQQ
jgi:hypothetical protein